MTVVGYSWDKISTIGDIRSDLVGSRRSKGGWGTRKGVDVVM